MTEYILIGSCMLCCAAVLILLLRMNASEKGAVRRQEELKQEIRELRRDNQELRRENQELIQQSFRTFGELISSNQKSSAENMDQRLFELNTRFSHMAVENEQKLENIRSTMEKKITDLTADNSRQLSEMRQTVDEKLQKTLENRITQSFQLVSQRLEQVYKGLGEMQNLAAGVGDLKKVLSNVKTRGILGEVQLSAILEQILAPGQYEENVATVPGSANRVEYAIKLPGQEGAVWLPIDAKFPGDTYQHLQAALQQGDAAAAAAMRKALYNVLRQEAKDIHDKYIEVPYTTNFGILFLPFEGLYAEVVSGGVTETLQRDYQITVAGPSTMAALLNALQMGFRTLAIQKRSGEVWTVLGAVKTEFEKFGTGLAQMQRHLNQTGSDLEELIGTRSRAITRKLESVQQLEDDTAREILGIGDAGADKDNR